MRCKFVNSDLFIQFLLLSLGLCIYMPEINTSMATLSASKIGKLSAPVYLTLFGSNLFFVFYRIIMKS